MDNYEQVLSEIKRDLKDSILSTRSMIQVNLNPGKLKWYYSDATMKRDFLSAKKELDEGALDFIVFEKIEAVNEEYEKQKLELTEMYVEDFIAYLESKIKGE